MRHLNRLSTVCLSLFLLAGMLLPQAAAAGTMSTPNERLEAIAPLLAARYSGDVALRKAFAEQATRTQEDEARLKLWLNLFVGHGKHGLVSLLPANARELAENASGTWQMQGRNMEGVRSRQRAYQFNQIAESRPGYLKVRSLTLEAGTLERSLREGLPGDGTFKLGAYGEAVYEDVTGARYGLKPGESAVKMTFDGEVWGLGYPGMDQNVVRAHIDALWVFQGDAYRTVEFDHEFFNIAPNEQFPGLNEPSRARGAATPKVDGHDAAEASLMSTRSKYFLTYSTFDSTEYYDKISSASLIPHPDQLWEAAKKNPALLDPDVAIQSVRNERPDTDRPRERPAEKQ